MLLVLVGGLSVFLGPSPPSLPSSLPPSLPHSLPPSLLSPPHLDKSLVYQGRRALCSPFVKLVDGIGQFGPQLPNERVQRLQFDLLSLQHLPHVRKVRGVARLHGMDEFRSKWHFAFVTAGVTAAAATGKEAA